MIGRIYDPQATTAKAAGERQPVHYVALECVDGTWQPTRQLGDDIETNRWNAAQRCAARARNIYRRVEQKMRALLTLCSTQLVQFGAKTIDSDLIYAEARELQRMITAHWPTFDQLLDDPGPDHNVQIRGVSLSLDDDGVLIGEQAVLPARASEPSADDEGPEPWHRQSLQLIVRALIEARESQLGQPIAIEELRDLSKFLNILIADREAEIDNADEQANLQP